MTKETMIWQTLSMIIAGLAVRKDLPKTEKEFTEVVIERASNILDYPEQDIKHVLLTINCVEFAKIMCLLYTGRIDPNYGNESKKDIK